MSWQQRQVREQLLRQEGRVRQALESTRAADPQAATLWKADNDRAKLQLLKAESRAQIPPWEGLDREMVLWKAARAKR